MNFHQLVHAHLADKAIERLRKYMMRGRPLAGLSEEALSAQWVEAYRAVMALDDQRREGELKDLRSEYDLRGLEPPLHLVSAEAVIAVERVNRVADESNATPEEVERFDAQLEELQERLSRPKH